MVAATLALVWAGSARADPPTDGSLVSFAHPLIVCDKADYLKDLIAAQRKSKDAFDAKSKELIADKKQCFAANVSNVVVGESEDAGTAKWGNLTEHLWITHVGDAKGEHWLLYEENVVKNETSI